MNYKLKIKNQRGFTLIEILAVLAIFGVVGAIATSILVVSLRTSSKATILTSVRQNGEFALNQISQAIRDARSIENPFPCTVVSPTPPIVSSSISFVAADGSNIVFSCNNSTDNPPSTIASNGASLLDNSVKMVDDSCSFTCYQQNINDYPLINISFSLIQNNSSSLTEKTASASAIPFTTNILMRNLEQ